MDPTAAPVRSAVTATARADACDPATLWRLLAEPRWWSRWAPHFRRARADGATGDTPVIVGDRVRIDGVWPVHVTAAITRVEPPVRWDFRVGLPLGHHLDATHEVLEAPLRVRVRMHLRGPLPRQVGTALLAAYRPVALLALHRLVTLARDRA
jgi:Polyketide cyclase / dehydrase and lipid transport